MLKRRSWAMKITITTQYITLGQFLKFTRIIANGGDAKIFLMTTSVYVNDELEQRRGRKLKDGDVVKVYDKQYQIVANGTK